jgi:hypothetical protein
MRKRLSEMREEIIIAQALIYFVFIGAATVAVAVAALSH